MTHRSCPGYVDEPFVTLVADYPGQHVYPAADFRTEWGPIFHRGRLDGSARVLVLGQDPATHESIARRILVGEAGQRVQGLLAKVGITRSYVLVNTFLYSVFGQGGGQRHEDDAAIAAYRGRWLDALLLDGQVTAVVTLGTLARTAYQMWATTQPQAVAGLHLCPVRHPTYPESAARSSGKPLSETTTTLLDDWNAQLPALAAHVTPEGPVDPTPYGSRWRPGDLATIPEEDLPAGSPPWWRDLSAWASREGDTPQLKRATIQVVVPRDAQTWPTL
ncbi:MAG: uracil-DNA glycosylase family protein [Dermatophilaceae bacterium]